VKEFHAVTAGTAVLDRADVDTDQIVPKQFLKRIERTGYGEFVFFDWMKDPDFELRRPDYEGARILITGRNFGCGSSREHAAWALQDYGFDAVVAPSFGDIFRTNSLKIGLLPIALPAEDVRSLMDACRGGAALTVDLDAQQITAPDGHTIAFEIDPFARECILAGLDDIGLTLQREDAISAYEASHPARVQTTALPV
jgi:3-isopropylmalate/(R)-2-methylmalate dehydratase small subunit